MTRILKSKYKIDRRLRCNLWGRPKSPYNNRNSRPGQHGVSGQRRKLSDYGNQLFAKQKLRFYYGDLTEKQFRRIFAEAERIRGDTGENLVGLLERRLDALVYRAKFVPTIFASSQFVNHGHIMVNGKPVNIPSYRVNEGDVVELVDKSKQIPMVIEAGSLPEREVPDYLEVNHNKFTCLLYTSPSPRDLSTSRMPSSA